MSASLQLAMNTVRSPVTQSGRVIFNGQKDSYDIWQRENTTAAHAYNPKDCDECYSVLTHELAFHLKPRKFQTQASAGDRLPVMTSFNHVVPSTLEDYAFIGVVSSGARHSSTSQAANEEDCTVQIGGLCTVVNTSSKMLYAGEPVYAQVHNLSKKQVKILGTPHAKVVAQVSAFPFTTVDAEVKQQQYIGRAMNSAAPGAPIDILLGSQC